ncbi:hypothetical protein C475_08691 [Halosimplex carlsbadense 2-9-1]|uniref:Uncharacterized protein n=1 Tax=Halosimplex carlsbadense 2-9-1 TaxID=797114 RepID=M0CYQ8_9EURY|nr:hypothetical protein [Halosimplex carlsbadense]ELZ26999.1 hypothetical protein C475_08691 [Halosimplex carlsbadense 2-9-1]
MKYITVDMNRRAYLGAVAGVSATTALTGCLQGDAVLHKTQISATSPTTEWEVELEAGDQMRLEVEKTDESGGRIRGYVRHAETEEEIATTTADDTDETFEVPTTGTYVVSVDARGATGEVILRDMD